MVRAPVDRTADRAVRPAARTAAHCKNSHVRSHPQLRQLLQRPLDMTVKAAIPASNMAIRFICTSALLLYRPLGYADNVPTIFHWGKAG